MSAKAIIHVVVRAYASAIVAAMLVAGCAASALPVRIGSPDGAPGSAPGQRRCGPSDPDQFGWFCTIGNILYGVFAASEGAATIRTK